MYYRYLLLSLSLLLCAVAPLAAQFNTLVTGEMMNVDKATAIELRLNEKYLDNTISQYQSRIWADGTFAFAVEIREPQFATLIYARNRALVWLQPNDTIHILASASSFPYSVSFSKQGRYHNEFYRSFRKAFPVEQDEFKYQNYRHGVFWYRNSPEMNRLMIASKEEDFIRKMRLQREEKRGMLNNYAQTYPDRLSPEFVEFMNAEIDYDYGYHLLLFGTVFRNGRTISTNYFDLLNEIPLQNAQIGNYYYREYLKAYINQRQHAQNENATNPYADQYDLAASLLQDDARAFVQSEVIGKGLKKSKYMESTLPKYTEFVEQNNYEAYGERVASFYQQAFKYTSGSAAPEFTLLNTNGNKVSLSDFQGQVVFLNFWASWCKPCMKKMTDMQEMQAELEAQGVVFLNVSLDRDEEIWRKTLGRFEFGGVHVFAPLDIDSNIATNYNVQALPQYYIIDKQGRFAPKPQRPTVEDIKTALLTVQ